MDYKKIVQDTLSNGGYTNKAKEKNRFVVAVKGHEKIVDIKDFSETTIKQYVEENGQEFGTWLYQGKVYLDKVETFENKEKAISEAKKRKELAIFDLETLNEIEL